MELYFCMCSVLHFSTFVLDFVTYVKEQDSDVSLSFRVWHIRPWVCGGHEVTTRHVILQLKVVYHSFYLVKMGIVKFFHFLAPIFVSFLICSAPHLGLAISNCYLEFDVCWFWKLSAITPWFCHQGLWAMMFISVCPAVSSFHMMHGNRWKCKLVGLFWTSIVVWSGSMMQETVVHLVGRHLVLKCSRLDSCVICFHKSSF